jgi:hypothetical protein
VRRFLRGRPLQFSTWLPQLHAGCSAGSRTRTTLQAQNQDVDEVAYTRLEHEGPCRVYGSESPSYILHPNNWHPPQPPIPHLSAPHKASRNTVLTVVTLSTSLCQTASLPVSRPTITHAARNMLLPGVLTSFAALLGIVTLASASPGSGPGPHRDVSGGRASTNAMRMANGLAPLRPRRLYDASRTRGGSRHSHV